MDTLAMPLQLFGTVTSNEGRSWSAMLCRDEDEKNKVLIHLWQQGDYVNSFAILFELTQNDEHTKLTPKCLYKVSENGAIWMPPTLSPDELTSLKNLTVEGVFKGQNFTGTWNLPPNSGNFTFNNKENTHSIDAIQIDSWHEFKNWVTENKNILNFGAFRGQGSNKFKLQTTFHRTKRCLLHKYAQTTLLSFQSHAEAVLGRRINLSDGVEYSTLLGLAQHHGLPTPMLDFTSSPYIAAFFAFSDALENMEYRKETTHIRIYVVTKKFIEDISPPNVNLSYISPYMCFLSVSGRDNPRLYVQQGIFLVTNIFELTPFINEYEITNKETALYAVDLPINCLKEAMSDLQYMGITAATLFPGLDGVGKMLRHEMLMRALENN